MKPPIPGIAPPEVAEVTSMIVWPTIGVSRVGRLCGRMAGVSIGCGPFTLGRLLAVGAIPLSLLAFAWLFVPVVSRRYRLTNRRIMIQKGLSAKDGPAIGLDEFDAIHVDVLPGQEWLCCGELRFLLEGREVFRLSGVGRPAVFREICLKARAALLSVREVLQAQAAATLMAQ